MEEAGGRSSFLTPRQLEIMRLRQTGMSTESIATAIGTTRQNVTILEKRAHRNIDRAIMTIKVTSELNVSTVFELPERIHILDAVREVLKVADRSGIRLRDNLIVIMTRLKTSVDKDMKGGIVQRAITVMLFQDGTVQFF